MAKETPNTVQILEAYWREHPAWFGRSYGEYLHLGANLEMLRLALAGVEITARTRVLDASCALGGNARWLASIYHCTVDGIDGFKPAIAAARQLAKAQGLSELCRFATGETDKLPYPDASFGLVITSEGEFSLREVVRVLAPGGIFAGTAVATEGVEALEASLRSAHLVIDKMRDVTDFARAFYRSKEAEAKLLVEGGLMGEQDMLNLQLHTVDLYDAGGARHAMFRARRPA